MTLLLRPEIAYIGLGSNLEDPLQQLLNAVAALHQIESTRCEAISGFYRSRAVGPKQPDYLNACARLSTRLEPEALLAELQAIEKRQRRVRSLRWGPRTLDLDILLFGNRTSTRTDLTLPHPRMLERNFVLAPLADLAPDLVLPSGQTVSVRLSEVGFDHLWRFGAPHP